MSNDPAGRTRFRKPARHQLIEREEPDDEAVFIATNYVGGGTCRLRW
jgi:hypothetical protein